MTMRIMCIISFILMVHTVTHSAQLSSDSEKRDHAMKFLREMKESVKSWVDPYDMFGSDSPAATENVRADEKGKKAFESDNKNVDRISTLREKQDDSTEIHPPTVSAFQHPQKNDCFSTDYVFLIRWLKIIVGRLNQKHLFSSNERKVVSFTVTEEIINKMHQVISADTPNMQNLEELFALGLTELTVSSDRLWTSYITILSQKEIFFFITSTMILLLFIFYVLSNFNKRTVFAITFVTCVYWNWMKLYKREISLKHATIEKTDIPVACYSRDVGFLQAIANSFSRVLGNPGSCDKYYEAVMVDPFWDVSPSLAIADTISGFLFVPLEVFSRVLNKCCKELLFDLPYTSQIMTVVFVIILLLVLFGYRVRLPFLFGALEPSENSGIFNLISAAMRSQPLSLGDQMRTDSNETEDARRISQNVPNKSLNSCQTEFSVSQVSHAKSHLVENDMKQCICFDVTARPPPTIDSMIVSDVDEVNLHSSAQSFVNYEDLTAELLNKQSYEECSSLMPMKSSLQKNKIIDKGSTKSKVPEEMHGQDECIKTCAGDDCEGCSEMSCRTYVCAKSQSILNFRKSPVKCQKYFQRSNEE